MICSLLGEQPIKPPPGPSKQIEQALLVASAEDMDSRPVSLSM